MEIQTVNAYQGTWGSMAARAPSVLRGNIHNALAVNNVLEPRGVQLLKNFALSIHTTVVFVIETQIVIAAQGNIWRRMTFLMFGARVIHVQNLAIWTRIITNYRHVKSAQKAHTLRH
jgi:hypothetical protein